MSEDNYEGLTISLKGHYRMINNEKKGLISEFVEDLKKPHYQWGYIDLIKKWEEKLK